MADLSQNLCPLKGGQGQILPARRVPFGFAALFAAAMVVMERKTSEGHYGSL